MVLSWKSVQNGLKHAEHHARHAEKTARQFLDIVVPPKKKGKRKKGVMVKGKCQCPG